MPGLAGGWECTTQDIGRRLALEDSADSGAGQAVWS
jgi:hypothetical protein